MTRSHSTKNATMVKCYSCHNFPEHQEAADAPLRQGGMMYIPPYKGGDAVDVN